jgi:hypothetical protein
MSLNIASPNLYGRSWSFTLGNVQSIDAIQFQNFYGRDKNGNEVPAAPLRIVFDVEKNLIGSPNKTKFDVYNLSLETRSQIRAGNVLQLKAGYDGLIDRIFFGQIGLSSVKTVRSGPDFVTSMECVDGAAAILMSRINKSYPPNTHLYQILNDVMEEMSTSNDYNPIPLDTGNAFNIPDVVYPRGKTINGSCGNILDELLVNFNMKWSVQNNSLIILPNKGAINVEAIIVSKDTGMIGIPTKNDGYVEFKSLLNPRIQPGTYVKLETNESVYNFTTGTNDPLAGFYEVRVAHYRGDTYGQEWSVTCQAWALDAKNVFEIQNQNVSSGINIQTSIRGVS